MSLIGWWKFDEVSGLVAADSSGSGLNGDLKNMVGDEWVAGRIGNALLLDGGNNYVDMGSDNLFNFDRTDPFSITVWVKTVTGAAKEILSRMQGVNPYRGYHILLIGGKPYFELINFVTTNEIQVYLNETINGGGWEHLAITYDGSSLASGVNIYRNSIIKVPVVNINNLISLTQHTNDFQVGARAGALNLPGTVDDVRVYDHELTQAEVNAIYGYSGVGGDHSSIMRGVGRGVMRGAR